MAFDLGSIVASIGVNTAKLDQGLMSAELKLGNFDKSISSTGQKLTAASTKMMMAGGLMVGAVAGVAIAAVKMASQFETSMRNVNSISKLSESEFKALGESVIGISKKFPQTAKELADGLYDIASSGFQGADGLKVLEASAAAASAGLTNTATSAKGITAVLNAYGLEAEDAAGISDTMFKTVDKGVISFEELSSTVGNWVGMGKAANISFNEMSGAIAYMTTKGIDASEAGTSLNQLITAMVKPGTDMAAMWNAAGYESGEAAIKQLGLAGAMQLVNDKTQGGLTLTQMLVPEMRGARGALALLGNGYEDLTVFMEDFKDTTGATAIALKEQSKSLDFQLKLLKNSASAIAISIGNRLIPSITKYVTAADGMTAANTELIASNIILAGKIGGSVAGVLLLLGAYGKVLAILKLLAGAGATVAGGATALAAGVGLFNMAQKFNELSTVITNTYRSSNDLLITLQAIAKLGLPTQLVDFFIDWTNKILGVKTATEQTTVSFEDSTNSTKELAFEMFQLKIGHTGVKEATEETTGAIENLTLKSLIAQVEAAKDKETLDKLKEQYGWNEEEAYAYAKATGLLTDNIKAQKEEIEALCTALYSEYLNSAAIDELLAKSNEDYAEYLKNLNSTGSSHIANTAAMQTWLAGNKDYQIAVAKSSELEAKINKLRADGKGETSACLTAEKSLETQRAKLNEITNQAAAATNSYTSTGKQTQAQIEATSAALKKWVSEDLQPLAKTWLPKLLEKTGSWTAAEYAQAVSIQENIDKAHQLGVDVPAVYDTITAKIVDAIYNQWQPALAAGINRLDDLDKQAGLTGSGIWTSLSTATDPIYSKFNPELSAGINRLIELDKTHCEPVVTVDISGFASGMDEAERRLAAMNGRSASTFVYEHKIQKWAMGGIVGYASGGVVMPQAASGMVVPQTGRAIPIMAHEYEDIVNTSQQRNLAEWIMGKANSRPDGKTTSNEVILHTIINLDGQVLWENNEKFDLRKLGERV